MTESAAYRQYCRICWYGGRCYRIAIAGSFANATNWAGIIGIGVLGFLLQNFFGHKLVPAETWPAIVGQGLLFIAAAWVVIFVVRLLFYAPLVMHNEGKLYGNKFVYREPVLAFHEFISPKQNNREWAFQYRDAPPFSLIEYQIEIDGPREHHSACVGAHTYQVPIFKSHDEMRYTKGSVRVDRDRNLFARFFLRHDTDPRSARIYVLGWEEHLDK